MTATQQPDPFGTPPEAGSDRSGASGPRAGFWRRFGAWLIDGLLIDLERGGSIGPGRAFIRYIGRIVSTIPLLLGYFWMIWDKENQTWHDKFAGSVVVPTSAYPVD